MVKTTSRYTQFSALKLWKGTIYPKKYAHGFCFAVLCCVYTLTDFPISIRLTSLALWQSNDCPIASKATLMNIDKYFRWIHYERLHNHKQRKHNETVCIFLGIYCNPVSAIPTATEFKVWVMYLLDSITLQSSNLSNLLWQLSRGWKVVFCYLHHICNYLPMS